MRGGWQTEAEIIAAEPGAAFSWSMRDKAGRKQDSVWSWFLEAHPEGAKLTHHFRMGEPTEGIKGIVSGMTEAEQEQFFLDWGLKLQGDLNATVETVKRIAEAQVPDASEQQ
ncbi:hypothetical protein [Segniliparus rugosus]|uniref:Uncharacterized protein n=1 Tax=Segniliparus rugosus (strain ATCC BAA-974 / DSM 45345 / CCUG 50838 / CIP 108380 / JCM 13579 / CDC 945) TaxID=679197 RepID=E5XS51_SEGRC|nr:hypothetical protein [Segniliparus rugosus]EFV12836.2 hypothetical protein HMPREF9336_02323 [Segniliparus rugosus ATCC BAA-974]